MNLIIVGALGIISGTVLFFVIFVNDIDYFQPEINEIVLESGSFVNIDTNQVASVSPEKMLFDITGTDDDFETRPTEIIWDRPTFLLKPELSELYDQIGLLDEPQNSVVVFPIFTVTAYAKDSFYDYYYDICDESCLTTNIKNAFIQEASGNGAQVLRLLGYNIITDVEVDQDPTILNSFDKVILLHNEYVTKNEFETITSHPNVIYLYPNALYAEIEVDYEEETITLIRGHGYPEESISNGFDWKYDNSQYEDDYECANMKFYKIDNGWMLNCYPDVAILTNSELLKIIREF